MLITNLTDAPGKDPIQVDIYNKTLDPGSYIKLPADLVTQKIRSLESSGLIAIGSLPPWYVAAKKRKGRPLTPEEKQQMQVSPPAPVVPLKVKENKEKSTVVELNEDVRKQNKG